VGCARLTNCPHGDVSQFHIAVDHIEPQQTPWPMTPTRFSAYVPRAERHERRPLQGDLAGSAVAFGWSKRLSGRHPGRSVIHQPELRRPDVFMDCA
jgi:hypothetical protein